jgi:hypothetical protein
MPKHFIVAITLCCLALVGRGQSANWKTLQCSKVSLTYPPTWHLTEERRGAQRRYTLTPDSMQHLTMRMFELLELPLGGDHDYAYFKKNFKLLLHPNDEVTTKILKTGEITFKGHNCMYAEMTNLSLPQKVYGIDAGNVVYLIIVTERRYIRVADPGLERDGKAILNSIAISE